MDNRFPFSRPNGRKPARTSKNRHGQSSAAVTRPDARLNASRVIQHTASSMTAPVSKADGAPVTPRRRHNYPARIRACKVCGNKFRPSNLAKHARYCSDACRQKAYRKRSARKAKTAGITNEKPLYAITCAQCQRGAFVERANTVYCSSTCKHKAWKRRRAGAAGVLSQHYGIPEAAAVDMLDKLGLAAITSTLGNNGWRWTAGSGWQKHRTAEGLAAR